MAGRPTAILSVGQWRRSCAIPDVSPTTIATRWLITLKRSRLRHSLKRINRPAVSALDGRFAVSHDDSGRGQEHGLARARSEKSLARFDRIALVLSGGGALGAYQAGAYAALENAGIRPNWIAGSAIGAVNATIIAGNLPHERSFRLRQFWRELSRRVAIRADAGFHQHLRAAVERVIAQWRGGGARPPRERSVIPSSELRELILELVDFERVNSGSVRVVLGATNL